VPSVPLLYVISIKALAAAVCANLDILGLEAPCLAQCLPKVSPYADDTCVIASSDSAIQAVFTTYDLFERGTGSKLNLAKKKVQWALAGLLARATGLSGSHSMDFRHNQDPGYLYRTWKFSQLAASAGGSQVQDLLSPSPVG